VVEWVQVHVAEELARLVADGKTAPALRRREQVVPREPRS
jgi:hypothetical protein